MKTTGPTFLGIGAPRAGTTWLYRHLLNHPEVWMLPKKELHFFDRSLRYPSPNTLVTSSPVARIFGSNPWDRPQIISGLLSVAKRIINCKFRQALWWSKWTFGNYDEEWYNGLFSRRKSFKVSGEISPSYSILEDIDVARIKAINPDMKIIFMVRNPIERAWSAVRYNFNKGISKTNLASEEEIIAALKAPSMIRHGDYERTLDTYLKFFDSSQVLVCFYEAIRFDPVGLMSGIFSGLGVTPSKTDSITNDVRINASPARNIPSRVKDYLIETNTPLMDRFKHRFGSYANLWDGKLNLDNMLSQGDYSTTRLPPVLHP